MAQVNILKRFPHRRKRLVKIAIFALLAVIVLGFLGRAYLAWQWNRTVLTVVNQSGGPVDNVEVDLGSGPARYSLGSLQNRQAKSVLVFPKGEDDMTLRFLSSSNPIAWHGGYIESTGGYRPRLIIGKNNAVQEKTGLYSL